MLKYVGLPIQCRLQLHSIVIDADASPSGFIAWYNHYTETSRIRVIRPAVRNEKFGVQRMEMLAVYFAIADNLHSIVKMSGGRRKKRRVIIAVRSDSKSTIEQLRGMSEVRDSLMRRIKASIANLLSKIKYTLVFDHLDRSRNVAGLLLEQKRRREREQMLAYFSDGPPTYNSHVSSSLPLITISQ